MRPRVWDMTGGVRGVCGGLRSVLHGAAATGSARPLWIWLAGEENDRDAMRCVAQD